MARCNETKTVKKEKAETQGKSVSKTSRSIGFVKWAFSKADNNGPFRFDPERPDFDAKDVLSKIISYSGMTWFEIERQTHDKGSSKHHYLTGSSLSPEALDSIKAKKLESDMDSFFSFALNNKARIIGIRELDLFYAVWYDPNHEFCPSCKKHT